MKSYITFFITALMTLALVSSLVSRARSKHEAPAEVIAPNETASGDVADAGVDGAAPGLAPDASAVAMADAGVAPLEKPLRVAALGWELAAAGAALAAPPGVDAGLTAPPMELAPESSLDAIEARLARGGADPQGADVAVLPLPAFVASFERLRALEPRAFVVVGFSRGREEVRAAAGSLLKSPPAADEVKLVAFGPSTAADATARAAGSESATVLGLFALDLLGVAPARIRLVAPGTPEAKAASFAAVVKGAVDDRPRAFSTADASRLVPIVAVASKATIDAREATLREWAKAWLDGLSRAKADVPGVARRLASKEAVPLAAGVGGAPEALVLVERLGQIENVGLDAQTSLIGPLADGKNGKTAATLDVLTQRTWQVARGGGFTAGAAPEPLPIDARIVSAIAPPPKDAAVPRNGDGDGDGGAAVTFGPIPTGALPNVAYRAVDGDAEKVASEIAFLAAVFERGVFRISAKGGDKAAKAIASAAHQRGVAPSRMATVPVEPQGAAAVVEVLSPP